jgi:DNA-binding transcriptional MerR regulator/methylmalonyl-CoA mutase cobalamin-binding subunit
VRAAARQSGLSPDVIRIWERRYGVVAPLRGPRGARLYSTEDVHRLRLLGQLVASGRRIGDIARFDTRRLAALTVQGTTSPPRNAPDGVAEVLLQALQRFDAAGLQQALGEALVAFGGRAFVRQVAMPLLTEVGRRWEDGSLSVADEHLVSGLLRNLLGAAVQTRARARGPRLLLATPPGERHELGLVMAALVALDAGCAVYLLGAEVPAADIVTAARRGGIDVVALAVVYRRNRAAAVGELRSLARRLPPSVELWVGGNDGATVGSALGSARVVVLEGFDALDHALDRLRAAKP